MISKKALGEGANGFCISSMAWGVCSSFPLGEMIPCVAREDAHIKLSLANPTNSPEAGSPICITPTSSGDADAALRVWKTPLDGYILLYRDGTRFDISADGSQVTIGWHAPYTLEDALTYFVGPVCGFILRLKGYVCLHGGAVEAGGKALALVGPGGAGKSTTMAALARRGLALLAEDVVAMPAQSEQFLVQPGYPRVNLWPESVAALYGSADALPPITPNWDKRYLNIEAGGLRFAQNPAPLGAVYLLSERVDDERAPWLEDLPPQQLVMELVANTYTNYLLDRRMRAREFEFLGRLIQGVPVRRVVPHADPARIQQLCECILKDFFNSHV